MSVETGSYRVVEHYYRQEQFDFYRQYQCPFYDVTFDLEFAALKAFARRADASLYLTLCYVFTHAMARTEDFLYRHVDGQIVLYDRLNVGMTVPAPGGAFSFAMVPFDEDWPRFYRRAEAIVERSGQAVSMVSEPWPNSIFFTALPGVPFTAFRHAPGNDPLGGEPKVAFGKFRQDGESMWIPVGIQVNHAFIDGRALGELYEGAQELFQRPEQVLGQAV